MNRANPGHRRGAGCLMPLAWWLLLLVLYFNFGLPPPVTGPFGPEDARRFSIATVDRSSGTPVYGRSTLQAYRDGGESATGEDYRLPARSIMIEDGDIDRVSVLDESDGVQRIEYVHNNSALVASIYRAGPRGIEPESMRVIANVASGLVAFGLVFPAYFLSWLTRVIQGRLANQSAGNGDAAE